MQVTCHRCTWWFHWYPRIYFGEYDYGRGYGLLVDLR